MNKNIRFSIIAILVVLVNCSASAQQWRFVKDIGFMDDPRNQRIKSLPQGGFVGVFNMRDSIIVSYSCAVAGNQSMNLVHYDTAGNAAILWKTQYTGEFYDFDIEDNGNIKTIGSYEVRTLNLNGTVIKSVPLNTGPSFRRKLKSDHAGNYYILLKYKDSIVYNTFKLYDNTGKVHTLLLKLNSADQLIWFQPFEIENQSYSSEVDMAIDNENNLIVRLFYNDTLSINNSIQEIHPGFNSVIIKFDYNGNIMWYKSMLGTAPQGVYVRVDANDNIYASGRFCDSLQVETTVIKELKHGYWCGDGYIASFKPNGESRWVDRVGSYYYDDNVLGFDVADDGSVYLTGDCRNTHFYIGNDSIAINQNSGDIFMVKLDANGNYLWHDFPRANHAVPSALCVDPMGNSFYTGLYYNGYFVVGHDSLTYQCESTSAFHFYLARLKSNINLPIRENSFTSVSYNIYPNPSNGKVQISYTTSGQTKSVLKIHSVLGELIYSQNFTGSYNQELNLGKYAKGIYLVELSAGVATERRKIVLE